MKCPQCGGEMKSRRYYTWEDQFIGTFTIETQPGEYWHCAECNDEILSYSLMKKIECEEQKRTEQLLLESVGNDYEKFKENLITNNELVHLLGKTRQAIQQDRRIKTLIFHVQEKSGQVVYWRKSAEKYKSEGDGRFALVVKEEKERIEVSELKKPVPINFPTTQFACSTLFLIDKTDNIRMWDGYNDSMIKEN